MAVGDLIRDLVVNRMLLVFMCHLNIAELIVTPKSSLYVVDDKLRIN